MRTRDRAALILTALALTFACLAVGGALRWTSCVAAFLGIASTLPYLTSRRTASRPSILLLPLAAMAALTLLQLVPLPIALAACLTPAKVDLLRANALAWGDPSPSWVAISYDPPATLVELAKLAGYLGLAWTCVRLAADRQGRRWLIIAAVAVATCVALVTLAHLAVGTRLLYGMYQPSTNLFLLGPLISANHLASLLTFAVPLATTLAVRATGLARSAWLLGAGLLTGMALFTGSRGGVVGLGAGLTVTAIVLVIQRRLGNERSRSGRLGISAPAAISAVSVLVLLATLTAGGVARDLSRTTLDEVHEPDGKYQMWTRAIGMTTDHRWTGTGKGAFEAAFTPYAGTSAVTYSHVENGYLQVVTDWGVPGGALVFLALGTAALAGIRRWRQGPLEAGALGALATLAVHDLVDFSVELPGVAMVAIASTSILFPERLSTPAVAPGADRRNMARGVIARRVGAVATGVIVVGLATSPLGRTAREDAARVVAVPAAQRLQVARRAFERHPADFALAARAAEALFERRDARSFKMMARGLSMNSMHAGLRRLAGRMLLQSGRPEQAAGEFAAAARWSRDVRPVVADVVAAFRDPEQIARALPAEARQAEAIVRSLGARPQVVFAYARRVVELNPKHPAMQALLAEAALLAGEGPVAVTAAETAWRLDPVARHAALLGRAMGATGATARGIELLTEAAARTASESAIERIRMLDVLVDLHLAAGAPGAAKTVLERCLELAGADRARRAGVHMRLALVEDQLGNRNQAAWERAQAEKLLATP